MSLHKITAGSGYDYLTRQVALHDRSEGVGPSLASYYTERGEIPGVWVGSGLAGIDGIDVGSVVTPDQMQSLFGAGRHPNALQIAAALESREDLTPAEREAAMNLGKPFRVFEHDVSEFRVEVARAFTTYNRSIGAASGAPIPLDERARIRSNIARRFFVAEFGREPLDARELSGHLARLSRQQTTAVAGYDLTFSPVKSVSALWAVAPTDLAARIEQAHHAAVGDALAFIEREALFTRLGDGGVRQVEVKGLVGTAFTHRDSRAGDPDLHTHVAVANKVQNHDGRWLSIDGRVLFKATVTASEVYNTALERHLAESLGVAFAARPGTDPERRPIREIQGVPQTLTEAWSRRRQAVEDRRAELAAEFQDRHGRPPTATEQIALAQQATLDTREGKHAPRTVAEQRDTWHRQAVSVLGGERALERMLADALRSTSHYHPRAARMVRDDAWFEQTAAGIVRTVQGSRATWQDWHLRAEAYRVARAAEVHSRDLDATVNRLVGTALARHSVAVAGTGTDGISDPRVLRRSDGTTQYSVSRAQLFTSSAVLDAEQRMVAAAGLTDGRRASDTDVDLAFAESLANGIELNLGQQELVRGMATSGARVQVAIAPAGSGKTTAMAALARAWAETGGTVLGLAPSAAAADQLRGQLDSTTDTLAKLVHHLDRDGRPPREMGTIDANSLVVIDEAGMADTLTLDRAVTWLLEQGASVRLIGDDQQLAAIGAGGVLRDIEAQHGVLRLRDLVRFADPAEAAATLALRDGRDEALGFYFDHQRVHVGDQASLTDDVFDAWRIDRSRGLDSIMLAPTRDLVAQLNARARADRLTTIPAGDEAATAARIEVTLSDGNLASAGDTIITRTNDRRLRLSATDWVKNGDRWTITDVTTDGLIRAQHLRSGLHVTLPADYVTQSVQLGYASTIHTAQGISVDTMHGLASPDLARQPLYTMLTRGRQANHLYLEVVGDGNEHSVIHPETINPLAPTDVLEAMLARDDTPTSATTLQRQANDPARRLADVAHRYTDALGLAAETLTGQAGIADLERKCEAALPGITYADDWIALRTQLLILNIAGHEPVTAMVAAFKQAPLSDSHDPAAVLAWRLDNTLAGGPLPWLPRIPDHLADHPQWGPYLTARANLTRDLAAQVADAAREAVDRPTWLAGSLADPTPQTLADVAVWRAAHALEDADLRPTGPRAVGQAAQRYQQALNDRLGEDRNPALTEWAPLLRRVSPMVDRDPFTPTLARLLAQLNADGHHARQLVDQAAAEGTLPDDHAAAALWWRINRLLPTDVLRTLDVDNRVPADWLVRYTQRIDPAIADQLQSSPSWPAVVHAVEGALQAGWQLDQLPTAPPADAHNDPAQALAWQILIATAPGDHHDAPEDTEPDYDYEIPDDLIDGWLPPLDAEPAPDDDLHQADAVEADLDLGFAAMERRVLPAPDPSDLLLREQANRADAWHDAPAGPERLTAINAMAADYYTSHYPGSWAQDHVAQRFGTDLADSPDFRPGYAPQGWTSLTDHLRRQGVTDSELEATGLAKRASTGRLIDQFRDRLVFPIADQDGAILGFVGRANPDSNDPKAPKYLNTGETPLFHKGAQLFAPAHLDQRDATPVVVEGPMDAIAVTLAGEGRYVGVAPLGTAFTDEQARQLHALGRRPIVATDNDKAGQAAAEKDYWLLAPYQLDPRFAALPDGADPADLIAQRRSADLLTALETASPLAQELLVRRITRLPKELALAEALKVIASEPADRWEISEAAVAGVLDAPAALTRLTLKEHIDAFNADPARASEASRGSMADLQRRLDDAQKRASTATAPQAADAAAGAATLAAEAASSPRPEDLARQTRRGPQRPIPGR